MDLHTSGISKTKRRLIIINVLFLAGIVSLVILSMRTPFKRSITQSNVEGKWIAENMSPSTLPPFSLVSQDGEQITQAHFLGKLVVANFIFTRCTMSCPKMSAQMASLQNAFHGDPNVKLVSFSVDPDYDTEAVLNDFANAYSAQKGQWYFLTGSRNQIYSLAHDFFHLGAGEISDEDKQMGAEEVLHSERFVLLNPEGQIAGYFNGMDSESVVNLKSEIMRLRNNLSR